MELVSTASRYVLVKGIKEGEHQLMAICEGKIYRKSIQVNYQNNLLALQLVRCDSVF